MRFLTVAGIFLPMAVAPLTGCGSSTPAPPPTATVSISPRTASIATPSQTQTFVARVTGTVTDLSVIWSVDGTQGGSTNVGTITANGIYTPPPTGGEHTIVATSAALSSSLAAARIFVTDLPGVFTYHNDLARTGANTQEYELTQANVNSGTFGKLTSCLVDGAVYAQPLWAPGISFSDGKHNLLIVATEHDSVFAFDADSSPCVQRWAVSLLDPLHGGTAGETPIIWNDVGNCYGDIYPEIGVTGTPVIDPATNTVYLVSSSEVGSDGENCSYSPGTFFRRIHALDLANGSEKFNGPSSVVASVPGVGDGSSGGIVSLDPQKQHQRSGLALAGGKVYVAWAAHEDAYPYHGWLLGYNASDLSRPPSIFNTTPNGGLGGIWSGGGAPAIDGSGDIYVSTGNGIFDANSTTTPFNDYGDSILRLHPFTGTTSNGVNLALTGWFTPYDQDTLALDDTDLGSASAVLLPDQASAPTHLLAQLGKEGVVYLIDRDNMGQFNGSDNNQIVQSFSAGRGLWGSPAWWENGLYLSGPGDSLKVFSFSPSTGLFNPSYTSHTIDVFPFPDATPSISSQGASNGIVWAIDAGLYGYASGNAVGGINCYVVPVPAVCTGPAVLHAYDANNLGTEFWNSTLAANNRDQAGNAVKFVPPTIANGRVFVATRTEIDVYGLLP